MAQIPFVAGAYLGRSSNVEADRLVNLYPQLLSGQHVDKIEVAALYGTPGLSLFATCGTTGPTRLLYTTSNGRALAVVGATLYEIFSDGNALARGGLSTNAGMVSAADNGQTIVIVDGPYGYTMGINSTGLAHITDPDFVGADTVAFIDGYFIFNRPNFQQFYISALYSTGVDALDFASAEGAPDVLISLLTDHREVWLFGATSTEVWFNSGAADFPFERTGGGFIEHGCAAKFSPAKLDNSVFWLGADDKGRGIVWRALGYQPQRISTHAVEYAISRYAHIENAVSWTYQEEGHAFYVLNFDEATWCYDVATGLWHERAGLDDAGELTRHPVQCHCFAHGKHLVGDFVQPYIYELSNDVYSDNGAPIPAIRQFTLPNRDNARVRDDVLTITMETGVGLDAGLIPGTDPQILLQTSRDGGHTWSGERWVSAGKQGEYRRLAQWRRLGQRRERVIRVKITDPVKRVFTGALLGYPGVGA